MRQGKAPSAYDLVEQVQALVSSLEAQKHYPGQHDQRNHGNRYGAHPTNPNLRLLVHQGGGKPGVNTHSEEPFGPAQPPKPKKPKAPKKPPAGPLSKVHPSKAWQNTYHQKQDEAWKNLAEEHGMSLDEYKTAVDSKAKELLDGTSIWMRRTESDLQKILNDGEFKTAFDVGMKPGAKYTISQRAQAEKNVFGLDKNLDPNSRPTYNYVSDDPNGGESWRLDGYGTIAIKMDDSIKEYSTVTAEDSMGSTAGGKTPLLIPQPFHSANKDIFNVSPTPNPYTYGVTDPLKIQSIGSAMNNNSFRYIEAQTHMRLKTSHIKEVVFRGSHPSAATQALLKEKNIPWRVK